MCVGYNRVIRDGVLYFYIEKLNVGVPGAHVATSYMGSQCLGVPRL